MATTPRIGITLPTDATNVTTQFFIDRYNEIDAGALPNSQKGAVNGVASLGADGKVPSGQLPALNYVPTSDKGVANGVATLDGTGKVPTAQIPAQPSATTASAGIVQLNNATNSTLTTQAATPSAVKSAYDLAAGAIPSAQKGAASGVASLDAGGKINESIVATKVSVTDTGNYYASADVEGSLQEIGSSLAGKETTSGAQTKANTAETNAKTYSDTQLTSHNADYIKHPGYAIATGTANTYAITLTPAPTGYVDGMGVSVRINIDSTGASTINVNGLGAKGLKKPNGTDITNLKANGVYAFRYNSSTGNFIVQGEGGAGNAVASDLLSGKTANTDAGDITGTMPNNGAVTITPGTTNQTIAAGYHNGSGVVNGDADLIASNIKSGVNIFGVVGTVDVASLGGKRVASGTVTSTSSTQAFTYVDGTTSPTRPSVTVTGLTFKPSRIILFESGNPSLIYYSEDMDSSYTKTVKHSLFYNGTSNSTSYTYNFRGDVAPSSVTNGSFTLPVYRSNFSHSWVAYE